MIISQLNFTVSMAKKLKENNKQFNYFNQYILMSQFKAGGNFFSFLFLARNGKKKNV